MKQLIAKSLLGLVLIVLASACSLKPASELQQQAETIQTLPTAETGLDAEVTPFLDTSEPSKEESSEQTASGNNNTSQNTGTLFGTGGTPSTIVGAAPALESQPSAELQAQLFIQGCTPQNAHWSIYIVVAGDTLTKIATRTGSTVAILAQVNCIANPNLIYVGQSLRVPQLNVPTPTLPHIDMGPIPNNACGIVPNGASAYIYGDGGTPFALLTGSALLMMVTHDGYWIDVPGFAFDGWVSKLEAHQHGGGCSQGGQLPYVGRTGLPPTDTCSVVLDNLNQAVNVYYGAGDAYAPIALLTTYAFYVEAAMDGYMIHIPQFGHNGFVKKAGVHLEGTKCPGIVPSPAPLPYIGEAGLPVIDSCIVTKVPTITTLDVFIYQRSGERQPIGIMSNYLHFVREEADGYVVKLPNSTNTAWVSGEFTRIEGTICPASMPPEVTCLEGELLGEGRVLITPSTQESSTCLSLQPGLVTVSWADAPADFEMVEFWRRNENGYTDVIGVDHDSSDGASITWQVHENMPPSLIYTIPYSEARTGGSIPVAVYIPASTS